MRVTMLDLPRQLAALAPALRVAFERVLADGRFVGGPEVARFEQRVAARLSVPHALGVSSGSDALVVALSALGVGAGHEVITSAYSFVATAESILRVGARPVFVDLPPDGFNLDAAAAIAALTSRTRALLPVHLFGEPCALRALLDAAERAGAVVVEDCAQAFGATLGARAVGTLGAAGAFSFFPAKVLGGFGDGGLVTTADLPTATRVRALRQHGRTGPDRYEAVGGNYRLDALQAALLDVALEHVGGFIAARRQCAGEYLRALAELPGLVVPPLTEGHVFGCFTLRVLDGRRDALARHLSERGVETAVYYATPLPLQPLFAALGHRAGEFPNAERAAGEALSLPVHPALTASERGRVLDAVLEFFRSR